jgi:hypothetical protein
MSTNNDPTAIQPHKIHALAAKATHDYYLRVEEQIRAAVHQHGGEIDRFEIVTTRHGTIGLFTYLDQNAEQVEFVTQLAGIGADVSALVYRIDLNRIIEVEP